HDSGGCRSTPEIAELRIRAVVAGRSGVENGLYVEFDRDPVADHQLVAGDRHVEVDAELLTADLAARLQAEPGASPGVAALAENLGFEFDGLGHAADREVAEDDVAALALLTYAGGCVGHHRVLLD